MSDLAPFHYPPFPGPSGTVTWLARARRGRAVGTAHAALTLLTVPGLSAQEVAIDASPSGYRQVIDGFGTCLAGEEGLQAWWHDLFLDDLGGSILRIDLVPRFQSPWSDLNYHSPWFLGRNNPPFAFNYESTVDDTPRHYTGAPADEFVNVNDSVYFNGPEGNRARTYSGPLDYARIFGGRNAPIAVMGPNIDDNIARYFDVTAGPAPAARAIVDAARERDATLARFKLIGAIWSPMPWVKVASGNTVGSAYGFWPFAPEGTPFPFIAGGNFVGGRLDVSDTALLVFDDSALPADSVGPNADAVRGATSALVQFARATAAYVRAVQLHTGVRFHSLSIQNELNFETFYNSCTYPLSSQYVKALRFVRAEFDKYEDLRDILIMGPEDLLSDSTWSLWQYGGGDSTVHKNLQYLQNIGEDPQALADLGLFCIHGYATDGVSAAGSDPVAWSRWADGWTSPPAGGLPTDVKGFTHYGKKSWMTETSGEEAAWLAPASAFPSNGGFSIALKIHQALTTGKQSAWIYWQLTDGSVLQASQLTDATLRAGSAKFTAMRHFARFIRPDAVRLATTSGAPSLLASAYWHDADQTLTTVLINSAASAATVTLALPDELSPDSTVTAYTSSDGNLWQTSTPVPAAGSLTLAAPGYSVITIVATSPASTPTTEAPVFAPPGGVHPGPVTVSMTSGTPGATIRYTTDGSDPTATTGTVFATPVALTESATIKAIAVQDGFLDSAITSADYQLPPAVPALPQTTWAHDGLRLTWSAVAGAASYTLERAYDGAGPFDVLAAGLEEPGFILRAFLAGTVHHFRVRAVGPDGVSAPSDAAEFSPPATTGGTSRLVNLSSRGFVSTGEGIMIPGFVVTGTEPTTLLIRGVGPTLANYGVIVPLLDPVLDLHQQLDGRLLLTNDDWSDMPNAADLPRAFADTGAFVLPAGSADAALLVVVVPGAYSAIVSGKAGTTGIVLVEVFEVTPTAL